MMMMMSLSSGTSIARLWRRSNEDPVRASNTSRSQHIFAAASAATAGSHSVHAVKNCKSASLNVSRASPNQRPAARRPDHAATAVVLRSRRSSSSRGNTYCGLLDPILLLRRGNDIRHLERLFPVKGGGISTSIQQASFDLAVLSLLLLPYSFLA
jgi:hypothetical protein